MQRLGKKSKAWAGGKKSKSCNGDDRKTMRSQNKGAGLLNKTLP